MRHVVIPISRIMKTTYLALFLSLFQALPINGQTLHDHIMSLDGVITIVEKSTALDSIREGESALYARSAEGFLWVAVKSDSIGVVSLCVANNNETKILHASAALGAITFSQQGAKWTTSERFTWTLRDTSMSTSVIAERREYFKEHGWVATTSSMGDPNHSEFLLSQDRFSIKDLRLAVGIMPLTQPNKIISLPINAGGCASEDLVRGINPDAGLDLEPSLWIPISN